MRRLSAGGAKMTFPFSSTQPAPGDGRQGNENDESYDKLDSMDLRL
jgi:hypothetical protein